MPMKLTTPRSHSPLDCAPARLRLAEGAPFWHPQVWIWNFIAVLTKPFILGDGLWEVPKKPNNSGLLPGIFQDPSNLS